MKFIKLSVRTSHIVHGYDEQNQEIVEKCHEEKYMTKLIAVHRIQSVSEQYLLVSSSHGRVMYWEYEESMEELERILT